MSPLWTGSQVRQRLPWFDTSEADLRFLRNGGVGKMSRLHSLSENGLILLPRLVGLLLLYVSFWFVCFFQTCRFQADLKLTM